MGSLTWRLGSGLTFQQLLLGMTDFLSHVNPVPPSCLPPSVAPCARGLSWSGGRVEGSVWAGDRVHGPLLSAPHKETVNPLQTPK